jgi:drug/metabolite transporter (DMT)-like permease
MMGWINAYAFFIFIGFTALFLGALLFWHERSRRRQVIVMLLFLAVVGSYWSVRPGVTNVTTEERAALAAISLGETAPLGQPVLVEAYTNY